MFPNLRPSQNITLCDKIAPVSQAPGTIDSGWVDMAQFAWLMATIQTGVLGAAATVDGIFQQATSAAGAGAKAVTGAAITQMVKATDDNRESILEMREEALDMANGFRWVRLRLTVGAAASIVGAQLLGVLRRNGPANLGNNATVKSITSVPANV